MYDFAVFLITAFSLYLFLTACLPFSVSLFRKFIYFVFTCIVVALLSPYGQITAFFGIFILIITLPFFASTPKLLTMCCSLWGYICAVVLSYILPVIGELIFHASFMEIQEEHYFLAQFIYILVPYFVLRIFHTLFTQKWHLPDQSFPASVLIADLLCEASCAALFIANFTYGEMIDYPQWIIHLNTALFSLFFVMAGVLLFLILRMFQRNQEYQLRLTYLSAAQEYSKSLEASYEEIKKFRHDYKNLLFALSGYLEEGDLPGARTYLSETLLPFSEKSQSLWSEKVFEEIAIPEIKGLLLCKTVLARRNKIDVTFFIPQKVESLQIETVDFVRILGIYLDNAIDAARESKEKKIFFQLIPENSSISLKLSNSFSNDTLTIKAIHNPAFTTKGKGHGHGLSITRDIFKQYPHLTFSTSISEGLFIQEIHGL